MRLAKTVATAAIVALVLTISLPINAESKYGKGVSDATEEVKLSELIANPDKYVGKPVRVSGIIQDVCPMKGCWMDLSGEGKEEKVRIKVHDGEMIFPVEAKGQRAAAEGVFTKIEMNKEQAIANAKHLAEEKGEKFDPATASVPMVIYQIQGTGAVIK